MAHSGSSYFGSSASCCDGKTMGDTRPIGLLPRMLEECRLLLRGVQGSYLDGGELASIDNVA